MKNIRLVTLLIGLFSAVICFAQPQLSYQKHALKSGQNNPMSYCSYMDPGMSGADVRWDFTGLIFDKSFTGYLKQINDGANSEHFSGANTVLEEFNTEFYFNVESDRIEQYGNASLDGKTVTTFDVPYIKVKFPFAYMDEFNGVFSGDVEYSGTSTGTVNGTYTVEADGYGTLLLPGGITYDNTLRVKNVKTFTVNRSGSEEDVQTTTYRWYNGAHRYPLLVLIEYTVTKGENTNTSYQAAYNNNAVSGLSPALSGSLRLYPNPASNNMKLDYTAVAPGSLQFTIIDNTGKTVRNFSHEVTNSGKQIVDLTEYISDLMQASYIMRIDNGDEIIKKSFVKFE